MNVYDFTVKDNKGKVDMKKLRHIAFDPFNNAYVGIGEKVGNAFSDGAKLK